METNAPRALPRRQVVVTMAGVMLAMFLASLDQTIVGTAMPRIVADLGGFTQYTWVTTAYIVTSAFTMPITGKLTDMYGRKPFYIAGLLIFTAASLLSGLSETMIQLIAFRGLQGIGAGIMMANTFIVIGDLFPPAVRGKYQGLITGVLGVSSIIGPTLGGFLTDTLSWQWVFFINIPLSILIIILFIFFFPGHRPDNIKHQIDYTGASLLILTVVPAMVALSLGGGQLPWLSLPVIGMFFFSALMLALFLLVERRSTEPILPLSLFRNRIVALSEVVIFFTAFGMFGAIIFVPLFFQGVLGLSATTSGSFLTPMMLGVVTGSLLSGQVLARAGGHYRIQGAAGIFIMALGMLFMSQMTFEISHVRAVVNIVLTGFGLGIIMPLYTIAVQNAVPHNILGVATASTAFFRSIGGSIGLAIFGSVLNNRFTSDFLKYLSPEAKAMLPPEYLEFLTQNPQALVSAEAQAELSNMFAYLGPQGTALLKQVLHALRLSLDSAVSQVFLIGFVTLIIAFILSLFVKEIPLRTGR